MSRYEERVSSKNSYLWVILVIIIVIFIAIWMFQKDEQVVQSEFKPIDIPIENKKTTEENSKEPVVEPKLDLTDTQPFSDAGDKQASVLEQKALKLEDSDDRFILGVKGVSEDLAHWFNVKGVIRKYIVIMNDLSQNQIIYKHRKFLKMPQEMLVKEDNLGLHMDQKSYQRYDRLANAIASIDVQKGRDLYLRFRPLLKQVFDEFGYPAGYRLEDIFMKGAASVMEAPVIPGKISLVRESVRYKFANKQLEALDGVKKQMIRMGPENTRKIQRKLRQMVEAIVDINE